MTQARLITPATQRDEDAADRAIRPKRLADYVGQQSMRAQVGDFKPQTQQAI